MKSGEAIVGVREFRSRFSAYLREVARGGIVTIGDRRRNPVARLVPAARSRDATHLADLAGRGLVQLGSGKPGAHRPIKPRRPRRTVADIVIEDRR
jgi:prevent-host-death family protein